MKAATLNKNIPSKAVAGSDLRILHTSDVHGQALAFDYVFDEPVSQGSLSTLAPQIAAARAERVASLLLDSGDFLQGTALSDRLVGRDIATLGAHPMITAMNMMGYDAATLGNHELDFGLPFLAKVLSFAEFPIVSANLRITAPGFEQLLPYTVLTRPIGPDGTPLRIGVTGCLPEASMSGMALSDPDITCLPPLEALPAVIRTMKAEGADIIVLLAHCGVDLHPESAEAKICAELMALEGIDVVLFGHTHDVHPSPNSPVLSRTAQAFSQPGARAEFFSQIDLSLGSGESGWRVKRSVTATLPNRSEGGEWRKMQTALASDHAESRRSRAVPVGYTEAEINSHFALVRNTAGLQLMAEAFAASMRDALKGTPVAGLPVLGAAAPYRTGQRSGVRNFCLIPEGPVLRRHVDMLYAFPDPLCALKLSGSALRLWLEMSASIFATIPADGQDVRLLDPAFPGYFFDVFPALDYQIDLSRAPRFNAAREVIARGPGRITALRHAGKALSDDTEVIVATTGFRAELIRAAFGALGGTLGSCEAPQIILKSDMPCRKVIADHIHAASPLRGACRAAWSFAPCPGATALFDTAPEARAENGMDDLGLTPDGFRRMRLHL